MENNIIVKNVCKKFDGFVLENVNLEVPKGSIVGLIGENGAGKTTLIKCILGILKMDSGSITLLGEENTKLLKEDIGVVLDGAFFAEILKVKDIHSVMKKIFKNWDESLFFKYLEDFKIPTNKQIKNLSKGMRKKLEIATAFAHHPKLLILDEPTSGLDPIVRSEILDMFLDFIVDENHSILLSSHITSDLEHIADYIAFMDSGKMVFYEEKDTLLETYGIVRCDKDFLQALESTEMIRYKKNKYSYDILIKDRESFQKKYKDVVIDTPNMDEMMFLYSKGMTK